uniref:formimidoylglutamate deiminase n=1 Tax=Pararhizobium sp. IMCC3301 TaxID=3067904 RepID=UPI00274267D3|nr:formimidoylglutamate deiminase [Pararhizobium sp. IMCC3301]
MKIFSNRAWLPSGWRENVRVSLDQGVVAGIEDNATAGAADIRVDTLLPALSNLHSHSFQRAMAGMTEFRAAGQDSFWTWRTLMYRFLDHLTPDHMEAIAALVFMEMQEAGYASVGEFHYVHHQQGGHPYDDRAELSTRILAAAAQTGIGLTHLPVLYSYGGANKAELSGGQLRFGNSVEDFSELLGAVEAAMTAMPSDTRLGIAPHSLRATAPDDLAEVVSRHGNGPIHIHIAEQPREVSDIVDWLGERPVQWLLKHQDVKPNWCLIHATHMTQTETASLAKSGAVVGLCPITEANLGDGPFNGPAYLGAAGAFGLGSDSNIRISLTEELRTLEYSQRLRDLCRNVMVNGAGSVGKTLYLGAAAGGAQALNRKAGKLEIGCLGDLVAIDSTHPQLCALHGDQLFDGLCFAADDRVVSDVWSAGCHMVKDGRHIQRDRITANYCRAIRDLTNALNA